jgi:hypothetical protein
MITNFPNGVSSFGLVLGPGYMNPSRYGNTYYVKKADDDDYSLFLQRYQDVNDRGYNVVHTTADSVFAVATAHDTIIFTDPDSGGHDLTETITIDQRGLKVYGCGGTQYVQNTTLKLPSTASDTDMFLIKTDKVEIAGLCFQNRKAGKCIAIGDTAGQAYYQIWIHDCNLTDYGGVATYGIAPGNADEANNTQVDPVNLVVERCTFDGFVTAAIVANGTRDCYIDNFIKVPVDGIGILDDHHTNSRGYGIIRKNYILGADDGDTGIKVTDVDSTAGLMAIAENIIENCETTITTQTNLQGFDNNSAAAATGAKTAIDIVT